MSAEDKQSVIDQLKSIVMSTKGGISLRKLAYDYRQIICDDIPLAKFGFRSLQGFLSSAGNAFIFQKSNGETIVTTPPSSETRHIQALVNNQKSLPKKIPRATFPYRPLQRSVPVPSRNGVRTQGGPLRCSQAAPPPKPFQSNLQSSKKRARQQSVDTFVLRGNPKLPVTEVSTEEMLARVLRLIVNISLGIPEKRVEVEFQEKFEETLPEGWRLKLEEHQKARGFVKFESFKLLDVWNLIPKKGSAPAKNENFKHLNGTSGSETQSNRVPPSETATSMHPMLASLKTDVNSNFVESLTTMGGSPVLPHLKDDVLVSYAESPSVLWLRLVSDQRRFQDLVCSMTSFYSKNKIDFNSVKRGDVMAAAFENLWYRIKVLIVDSWWCIVERLDSGKRSRISVTDLQPLAPQFRTMPPLAYKAQISGSKEKFSQDDNFSFFVTGRMFVCYSNFVKKDGDTQSINVVSLIDTSGENDLDVSSLL